MKTPYVTILVCVAAFAGFVAGRYDFRRTTPSVESHPGRAVSPKPLNLVAQEPAAGASDASLLDSGEPGQPNSRLLSALRGSLDANSEFRRLAKWSQFLEAMRAEDASAVRDIFRAMEQEGRTYKHERDAFWARWGELDGEAAIEAVNEDLSSDPWLHRLVLNGWVRSDAAGAIAWLEATDENMPARQAMFTGLALGLSQTDPPAALEFLGKQADPQAQASLAWEAIWGVIYTKGQKDARDWMDQLAHNPDIHPETTHTVLSVLLQSQLRGEPADFLQYVNSRRNEPWFDKGAVDRAWQSMAHEGNPEKVLNAAAMLPDDEFRGNIANVAVERFMRADHNSIGVWLSSHVDSPLYDQVTSTFAMRVKGIDAEAADAWAKTIKDESLRLTTLEKLNGPP